MRRTLAVGVVLVAAIATGSAGAAQDAQRLSYFQATGNAFFTYTIDYGSHPDSTFNGRYTAQLAYRIRTLVSYDGRKISTITRPLVQGYGIVPNGMTVWTGGPRTPVPCAERPLHRADRAQRSSGAHVSVGGGIAHLDPGSAIRWPVGCAATESLGIHGLPDGKTITGGASVRRFRAGIACSGRFHHFGELFAPNGHSFDGRVSFSLKFAPIAAGHLDDARRALRRQVGRDILYREPRPASFRDCLDPR